MAAPAIMAAQLIVGGWIVTSWFMMSNVLDIVTILIFGASLLAGVPGSVLTHIAVVRRSSTAAKVALWWACGRWALLVGVTAVIVTVTDVGPDAEWYIDGELIVLGLLEIAVSFALAYDTLKRITREADAHAAAQRLTQV